MESLTSKEKIKQLTQDVVTIQAMVKSGALSIADTEYYTATLKTRQVELEKEKSKLTLEQKKQAEELEKSSRLTAEQQVELFLLQKKGIAGLTEAERARYDILTLQTKEKKLQAEVDALVEKGVNNLTTEEKARLSRLLTQKDTLDKQIAQKEQLTKAADAQANAEQGVTDEMKKQSDQANKLLTTKFQITGQSYSGQSTRELEENIAKLKQQIFEDNLKSTSGGSGILQQWAISEERGRLAKAESELAIRSSVQSLLSKYGSEGEAYKHWTGSAADFERGMTYSSDTTETQRALTQLKNAALEINDRLKNGAKYSTI